MREQGREMSKEESIKETGDVRRTQGELGEKGEAK